MMNINQEGEEEDEPVMLLLMVKIVFPNLKPTIMFMDDGSMGSIITHKLAVFLGLKRKTSHTVDRGGAEEDAGSSHSWLSSALSLLEQPIS